MFNIEEGSKARCSVVYSIVVRHFAVVGER